MAGKLAREYYYFEKVVLHIALYKNVFAANSDGKIHSAGGG